MEYINKQEIQGSVGFIKITGEGDDRVAHLSVVTQYAYRGRDGQPVVEAMWHNVMVSQKCSYVPLDCIAKGDIVHSIGRLQAYTFEDPEGELKRSIHHVSHHLKLVQKQ